MVSSFHPHSMCKKVERLAEKLDAFRVQNGQSLSKYQGLGRKLICYKGISLFWTPDSLCVQNAPFIATSAIFNPFWLHLLFFMHLLIFFRLYDPEIEKHYRWTLKRLKVGMVSSFHPNSMCNKVERVMEKLDDFVYKTDNLFRNIRVSYGNSSVTKGFHFFEFIWNP